MKNISCPQAFLAVAACMVASALPAFDCSDAVKAKAQDFIDNEKQFHLGFLPTEQSNPITATLEEDFKRSTVAGVQCLQRADRQIPITLRHVFASPKFASLVDAMAATLTTPPITNSSTRPLPRIVFSGCGATGRLAILLESMWRDFFHRRAAELTPAERALAERSASIMTGGDFALIKSVESFEDSMPGGERQAAALNIGEGDTFVAITEGGETSSVLGTLRYAAAHGAKCFLVFNNPAGILRARLDRSREAIDNPKVTVLDIYCGSMALAGSTRMQATSSEQLLCSCALEAALCRVMPRFAKETAADWTTAFEKLLSSLESPASRKAIAEMIEFEKALYARGGRVTYFADDCMLDLFTDTTERSPTFMLPPFRSTEEKNLAQSWAFVKNPLHSTPECWDALFHRPVRCLEWTAADYAAPGMPPVKDGVPPPIGRSSLMKYPIGNEDTPERYAGCESAAVIVRAGAPDAAFESAAREQASKFGTVRLFALAPTDASPLEIWKHLAMKLTFNTLSTGTMAASGRVAGNWMSWVSISNKKLVDRGIRLISELGGIPYEEAAQRLFAAEEWIQSQDWTGKETPCAVQVALKRLREEKDRRTSSAPAADAVEVRVRKTPGGPRIFVDGRPVRPRIFYGAPPSLANLSESWYTTFVYPFRATLSTTNGTYRVARQSQDDALFFKNARFVDMTTGVTNDWGLAEETRMDAFTAAPLTFEKDHVYRFLVDVKATRDRQFLSAGAFAVDESGRRVRMPLPYGDTLAGTTRLAASAGVNIVTFSANSYGSSTGWVEPGKEPNYDGLDRYCRRLVEANPNVLLLPRVSAEAPAWLLKKDPSIRMKFDRGFTLEFASVSARPYREQACAYIERLTRHLREAFPRNFAGLHISGQNSGEWFYHLSQSADLSGYDVHTRDAFRAWLAKRGEPDAATAEVPSPEERRDSSRGFLRDPVRDRRLLDFEQFRQEEVATFLSELGAAVRRGSDGHSLALFFYGYFWELGGVMAGASETGHYALQWLLEHGAENVDGLSGPFSYTNRRWPGSSPVMSPAETIARAGILWINEDDTRTYLEDIWCYKAVQGTGGDRWKTKEQTCDQLLRNASQCILRGQGDWWMDLFGRGWYADAGLWDMRAHLNRMDDALLGCGSMVEPDVAVLVDERSFLYLGWNSDRRPAAVLMNRRPFDSCGAPYGQYTLDDWLAKPTSAKICFVPVAFHLTDAQKARLAEVRDARPGLRFVWFAMPGLDDGTAAELKRAGDTVLTDPKQFNERFVGEQVRAAGARSVVKPGVANVAAGGAFTMVQSVVGGDMEVDFGASGEVFDYMTGKSLGSGPRLVLPFRKGETRVFELRSDHN